MTIWIVRTIRKALIVFLQISFCALAPGSDGHGVVLVRISGGGEFVEMRTGLILPDDEEPDSVWTAAVFLSIYLGLCAIGLMNTMDDTRERK